MKDSIQYSMFLVDDTPYCVWEWDLRERNLAFIESIDHEYFSYIAETHANQLEGPHSQRAAISLRAAYHHGLETFFTLICATIQAPDCIIGWVQKCPSRRLRKLVGTIQQDHATVINKIGLREVNWKAVSNTIHCLEDGPRTRETKDLFADLWGQWASDYLDDMNYEEYNSIKHGFRARAGGFTVAMGKEHQYGVPPPPQEMHVHSGSEFGSSFYSDERIQNAPDIKGDLHFRVRSYSLNWQPELMVQALQLISLSIGNIISYLKILDGVNPETVHFKRPKDSQDFLAPRESSIGIFRIGLDRTVDEQHIHRFSAEQIRAELQRIQPGETPTTD